MKNFMISSILALMIPIGVMANPMFEPVCLEVTDESVQSLIGGVFHYDQEDFEAEFRDSMNIIRVREGDDIAFLIHAQTTAFVNLIYDDGVLNPIAIKAMNGNQKAIELISDLAMENCITVFERIF